MTTKSKVCDDAHTTYAAQVSTYNDAQRLFYERQLPSILSDLQLLDGKRSDELKNVVGQFLQSHLDILPRIQLCLDEMAKQNEQSSSFTDALMVIEQYRSGYAIPDDQRVVPTGSRRSSRFASHVRLD